MSFRIENQEVKLSLAIGAAKPVQDLNIFRESNKTNGS